MNINHTFEQKKDKYLVNNEIKMRKINLVLISGECLPWVDSDNRILFKKK